MKSKKFSPFILFVLITFPISFLYAQIILDDQQPLQAISFDVPSDGNRSHQFVPPAQPEQPSYYHNPNTFFCLLDKNSAEFGNRVRSLPVPPIPGDQMPKISDPGHGITSIKPTINPGDSALGSAPSAAPNAPKSGGVGIRVSSSPGRGGSRISGAAFVSHWTVNDFGNHFNSDDPEAVYENYELYKLPAFIDYARQIGDFNEFLVRLARRLHADYYFREGMYNLPGFYSKIHFKLKWKPPFFETKKQSEFLDMVWDRAASIEKHIVDNFAQEIRKEHAQNLAIRKDWLKTDKEMIPLDAEQEAIREERRLDALEQDLFDPGEYEQHFDLHHATKALLAAEGIDYRSFEYAQGTAVQINIHEELIHTLNETSCLDLSYGRSIQVGNLCKTIYHCTDVTIDLNRQDGNEEQCYALSNFCNSLYQCARSIARGIGTGLELTEKTARMIAHVADRSIHVARDRIQEHINGVVNNPISTLARIGVIYACPQLGLISLLITNISDCAELVEIAKIAWHDTPEGVAQAVGLVASRLFIGKATRQGTATLVKATKAAFRIGQLAAQERSLTKGISSFSGERGIDLSAPISKITRDILGNINFLSRCDLPTVKRAAGAITCEARHSSRKRNKSVGAAVEDSVRLARISDIKKLTINEIINKICRFDYIGANFFAKAEKAGGHTIERHFSKSNQALNGRFKKDSNISASSSFTNQRTALKALQENLRNNARLIAEWLKDDKADKKMSFDFIHKYPIGKTIPKKIKANNAPIYDVFGSKVVLIKDAKSELGFKAMLGFDLKTAFPIDI